MDEQLRYLIYKEHDGKRINEVKTALESSSVDNADRVLSILEDLNQVAQGQMEMTRDEILEQAGLAIRLAGRAKGWSKLGLSEDFFREYRDKVRDQTYQYPDEIDVVLAKSYLEQTTVVFNDVEGPYRMVKEGLGDEGMELARESVNGGAKFLVMDIEDAVTSDADPTFISRHMSAKKAYDEAMGYETRIAVTVLDGNVIPIVDLSDLRIFKTGLVEEDDYHGEVETHTFYVAAPEKSDVPLVVYEELTIRGTDRRQALNMAQDLEEPELVSIDRAREMKGMSDSHSVYERLLDEDEPCVLKQQYHGPFK